MSTVKISVASAAFGKSGQYIAKITGRDEKKTFAREFIGEKSGKRNEITSVETDEIGVYEDCDVNKKGSKEVGYLVVLPSPAGELESYRLEKDEALTAAKRLDAGESVEDMFEIRTTSEGDFAYLVTKAAAKKAIAAKTADAAADECWAILGALPADVAAKVLGSLRKRLKGEPEAGPTPIVETSTDVATAAVIVAVEPAPNTRPADFLPGLAPDQQGDLFAK